MLQILTEHSCSELRSASVVSVKDGFSFLVLTRQWSVQSKFATWKGWMIRLPIDLCYFSAT